MAFAWHKMTRGVGLSRGFIIAATLTVGTSTLLMGILGAAIVQSSILNGVAQTANSSIESLIYSSVQGLREEHELSPSETAALDAVFAVSRESSATRLIQFALFRPDGSLVYLADGDLSDTLGPDALSGARSGKLVASLETVQAEAVGALPAAGLRVLRILAPLSDDKGQPFLLAVLYLSARDLIEAVSWAQLQIWMVLVAIGLLTVAALHLMVDRASGTIAKQRSRIAANLKLSRQLTDENRELHSASEALRLEASKVNESLLARVGSDIHDGPVQLLTLLILQLSREPALVPQETPVSLAQAAIEELRNISSGLVLPELGPLGVEDSVRLAISRHERATGSRVRFKVGTLPHDAPMAVKICAYRIVQESLNNGFRHGGGEQTVTANIASDHIEISIRAAAPGIGSGTSREGDRLGLVGMRLRAEALGGKLEVDLEPESHVLVRLPFNSAATVQGHALRLVEVASAPSGGQQGRLPSDS